MFKTFFQGVPAARANDPIGTWLRRANTTPTGCLPTLGLEPRDCLNYHVRGVCRLHNCTNNHTVQQLENAKVQQVIDLLRQGLQSM